MALDPVSALLEVGSKVIDRVWPDSTKAAEAKLELLKLQTSGELQAIAGQLEVNREEARNPSIFVSGWRPFIGWICGVALTYQYLLRPIISLSGELSGHPIPDVPGLDDNLWELLLGLLGLGGLRTFEKVKGVART